MNINFSLNQFIMTLMVILSIAFYTLMERKFLSYQQNRKGPNKTSLIGLAQPINDALKLLSKKEMKLTFSNNILYWAPPIYSFFMFIFVLNLFVKKFNFIEMNMSIIVFFCIIALTGFSTIVMGWASNSKYTILGSIRALAQSISYEVLLILSLWNMLILTNNFSFQLLMKEKQFLFYFIWTSLVIFFISIVCELNRAPFDLSEGESELVSGFNTEYGMTKFSMIFLSEYGMMIFMSMVMTLMFNSSNGFLFFLKMVLIMMLFLWLRSSYPRLRYDKLMHLNWKNLLLTILLLSMLYMLIL